MINYCICNISLENNYLKELRYSIIMYNCQLPLVESKKFYYCPSLNYCFSKKSLLKLNKVHLKNKCILDNRSKTLDSPSDY